MQDNTPSSSMHSKYLLRGGSRKDTAYPNQQIHHKKGFGLFIRVNAPSYAKDGLQGVRGGTGKELEGSMNTIVPDGTVQIDDACGQNMWGNNKGARSDAPVQPSAPHGGHHGAFSMHTRLVFAISYAFAEKRTLFSCRCMIALCFSMTMWVIHLTSSLTAIC
jgi:hypothetical protein